MPESHLPKSTENSQDEYCKNILKNIRNLRIENRTREAITISIKSFIEHPHYVDESHEPAFLKQYIISLIETGNSTRAKEFLEDMFCDKIPLWCHITIGRAAIKNGDVDTAIESYLCVHKITPNSTEVIDALISITKNHRSRLAAIELIRLYSTEDNTHKGMMADLARIFTRNNDQELASGFFRLAHGHKCRIVQTSDPVNYFPMIMETLRVNQHYASLVGASYECFLGLHVGYHPWHATFNRIPMLKNMIEQGYYGWVLYIDADAYIYDYTFDLWGYLDAHKHEALIAAPGSGKAPWDINIGIFFINLGSSIGREIVNRWHAEFESTLTESTMLNASEPWVNIANDQSIIQGILRDNPEYLEHLYIESNKIINSSKASFIRQKLRRQGVSFAERLDEIRMELKDL
ncbi:hypothetical protein SAMN02799631_00940 [Methylobacterium sp. 174MFSha1.1]|uniref:hypothetical protein n=1 Tax=Methylobacterium sp. 174MFSha1.1 TaxID=1502749 RepID=UPI0008F2725B|nr:hypothetical protein [Methylobacterium sp. 174MFSha1.1]SFU49490.1 hypothetical protein SAMN02799631_00940 [Methylobacterium sp. 174MFSha1.1]